MSRLQFGSQVTAWLRAGRTPVLVTGAGGWLGQAVLEMLDGALGDAMPRQVTAMSSAARPLRLRSGRVVDTLAYRALDDWAGGPGLIFHFAFRTREHAAVMPVRDYIAANRAISAAMSSFIERCGCAGLVLPSSGAVYDPCGGLETNVTRNPYGALKYEDETVFAALSRRLAFPAALIRVFNLAGPFINKLDSYALASIIGDVAAGRPVGLRAAHPVWRSYTHVEDMLCIATEIVRRGIAVPAFDTAGAPVEIGGLAVQVHRLLAPGGRIAINRPDWKNRVPDRYLGAAAPYKRIAGICGVTPRSRDQQIFDTAAYLAPLR